MAVAGAYAVNPIEGHHSFGWVGFESVYTVGGSGALTGVRTAGIRSITRNGAGDYTMVLDAKYVDIYNFIGTVSGTFTRTDGTRVWLSAISTDTTTGATSIQFFVYVDSGAGTTKTDIASGNTLRLTFAAKAAIAGY